MADLKSDGFLIVINLIVEGSCFETGLILTQVYVLRRLEYCSGLVFDILWRDYGRQIAFNWLPGWIKSTTEVASCRIALRTAVVVYGWLHTVVGLAAEIGGLALAFHLRFVPRSLLLLGLLLNLSLVLGKYGVLGTSHVLR